MVIANKEWQLVKLAGELSGIGEKSFQICHLLGVDLKEEHPETWKSTLNDDGSPLEVCITMSEDQCRYRLIVDPEPGLTAPIDRLSAGQKALAKVVPVCGVDELAPFFAETISFWIRGERELAELTRGVMWVAAGLNTPGVAIYLDGRIDDRLSAWERARQWYQHMFQMAGVPDVHSMVDEYIDKIQPYARLGSIGLEGTNWKNARLKVHWRLVEPVRLDELRLPLLENQIFPQFMQIMAGGKANHAFSRSGLIFSTGFSLMNGSVIDSKLDLCGCHKCLNLTPEEWLERLASACQSFDLTMPPVEDALLANRCAGIILGLGLDIEGRRRLNFYLKPGQGNDGS